MQRDDEREDEQDTPEQDRIDLSDESLGSSGADGAPKGDDANSQDALAPDSSEAADDAISLADELAALREAEASAEANVAPADLAAEPPAADVTAGETELPVAAASPATESPRPSQGDVAEDGAETNRPYFGPIRRLDDLPQDMIEHLDEQSAANLLAAIRNPEKFEPGFLDDTTIRNLYSTMPRERRVPGDDESPWYHSELPPVRLEVVLLKYDWMVEKVLERAAKRMDRDVDQKLDSRFRSELFHIRCEIRNLLR